MKNKKLFLIMLLLLGVGFAAVSTTLYLTGNVNVVTNNDDFDVIFTRAVIDGVDTPSAIIDGCKTISFNTKDLVNVGDISKLDFDVTNNSAMYDAKVNVSCSATGANSSYFQITTSGSMEIAGNTKEKGNVEITLKKAALEDIQGEFTCTLTATAVERTEKAPVPAYYAFGYPLTPLDKTTEYETLKYPDTNTPAKVFVKIDGSQNSVCTLATGSLECFKNNNVEEEREQSKRVFGETNCSEDSYGNCSLGNFSCAINSSGVVSCGDNVANLSCVVNQNGDIRCGA